MKQELKTGDTFEVFKVITDGSYKDNFLPETFRIGYYKPKTEKFANVLCEDGLFRFMIVPSEVVPIGRVIIKALK